MVATTEILEARRLLEDFERQRLSVKSLDFFAEAVDLLIDSHPTGEAQWIPPACDKLVASYARSLLLKMENMDRKDEDLVIAIYRIIHQRIYPAIVAAVQGRPNLAKSYDDMLLAWPSFSPFFFPIIGPEVGKYLARFGR